jgi:hypothetical protein
MKKITLNAILTEYSSDVHIMYQQPSPPELHFVIRTNLTKKEKKFLSSLFDESVKDVNITIEK